MQWQPVPSGQGNGKNRTAAGPARAHGRHIAAELMPVMARACGHGALDQFSIEDLTTWKKELSGIGYAGVGL